MRRGYLVDGERIAAYEVCLLLVRTGLFVAARVAQAPVLVYLCAGACWGTIAQQPLRRIIVRTSPYTTSLPERGDE